MPFGVTYPVPALPTVIALTRPLSTLAEAVAPAPLPTESVIVTVGDPVYPAPNVSGTTALTSMVATAEAPAPALATGSSSVPSRITTLGAVA